MAVRYFTNTDQIVVGTNANIGSGFNINGTIPVRFSTDSTWTTSNVTFDWSEDGSTWQTGALDIYGNVITLVSVPASKAVVLPPALLGNGFQWLRLRSVTNQVSNTTMKLVSADFK